MYYCCAFSDTGNVREHNEDAFLIDKKVRTDSGLENSFRHSFIVAVADGVAGENSGEIASRMALKMLSGVRPKEKTDYREKILDIHRRIRRYGIKHNGAKNMQTTLSAFAVDNAGNHIGVNVGDSRIYRYRSGRIRQLSADQSVIQSALGKRKISILDKSGNPYSHMILPVIGNTACDPEPQIIPIESMEQGDIILICSDGLSDYITDGEFEEILALPIKLPKRLKKLAETAMKNGSADNITVLAVSTYQ